MAKIQLGEQPTKRYVATMRFYVNANSDAEAKALAIKQAIQFNQKEDNRASIDGLCEQQFGKLGSREIKL